MVIINSNKPKCKYFGYDKSTHFIVGYTGTPVTHVDEYSNDLLNFDYRIICLGIGTERQIRTKEGDMSVEKEQCNPGITQCHKAGLLLGCKLTLILIFPF